MARHDLEEKYRRVVDWRMVDKDLYMQAMERSPVDDLSYGFFYRRLRPIKSTTEKLYSRA